MEAVKLWFKGESRLQIWGLDLYTLSDIIIESKSFMSQLVLLNHPNMCIIGPAQVGGQLEAIDCRYV